MQEVADLHFEKATDLADASGTMWIDLSARNWSDRMLEASGLNRTHMPQLVEGTEVSGWLRPALAAELGLPAGIPVAGGAGDNAATAIGAGTVAEGQGFVSLGTSGVIFAATDRYLPRPESASEIEPLVTTCALLALALLPALASAVA